MLMECPLCFLSVVHLTIDPILHVAFIIRTRIGACMPGPNSLGLALLIKVLCPVLKLMLTLYELIQIPIISNIWLMKKRKLKMLNSSGASL